MDYFYNFIGMYDQTWIGKIKGYDKNAVLVKDYQTAGSNYKFDSSIDIDQVRLKIQESK